MQLPQVLLAAMCLGLGIMPAVVFHYLQKVLDSSLQGFGIALADAAPMTNGPLGGIQALQGIALFAPVALAVLIGSMFLVTRAISKLGGAQRRSAAPWLCGYVREADCHRYTAHNFYGEIKRWFRWLGGAPHPVPGKQDDVKGQS